MRLTKNQTLKQLCLPNIRKSDRYPAIEPLGKIDKLKKALILTPYAADLLDPTHFIYPNDLSMPQIIQNEIFRISNFLRTKKAPGSDQIPNEVIKVIKPCHLQQIFNDSLSIDYYHIHFRESVIIILRKLQATETTLIQKRPSYPPSEYDS